VRRTILILGPNTLFGLEEVMSENPKRLIRARAIEDNTECLYANKGIFMEYFNSEDKERIKALVSQYTNFENEARLLLHDIQNKKTQVSFYLDHLIRFLFYLRPISF
jgi:CRP-like cAMP-binding protein